MTRALGLVALLAILAFASIPTAAPAPLGAVPARQEEATVIEVGAGLIGDRAFALTGRTEYRPDAVALYGYLSAVIGLASPQVFTDPNLPSAATARFTYTGEAAIANQDERDGATQVTGEGTLSIYFAEPAGADFADPASFAAGEMVATMTITFRDALQLATPGFGVVVGNAQASQTESRSFALDNERYRFGHLNAQQRLRFVGGETPADGDAIVMSVDGTAIQTSRDPNPTGSPDPTQIPVSPECAGAETWLPETSARLERVIAIIAEVPLDAPVESLDAAALGDLAAEVETMLQAQQETAAPPIGLDAHRLARSALSRTGQGLRLLADAAAGNAAALVPAQAGLSDGATLAARAADQLAAVAAACQIEP